MLTFYLGRYALNGTFIGFEVLRDQLNLCPLTYDDVLNMMRFGAVTQSVCEFELAKLIDDQLPKDANYFFDLYIKDRNENLIDVPIVVKNYRKGEKLVNSGSLSNDWQLVRRFFIYDGVSGYADANSFLSK